MPNTHKLQTVNSPIPTFSQPPLLYLYSGGVNVTLLDSAHEVKSEIKFCCNIILSWLIKEPASDIYVSFTVTDCKGQVKIATESW